MGMESRRWNSAECGLSGMRLQPCRRTGPPTRSACGPLMPRAPQILMTAPIEAHRPPRTLGPQPSRARCDPMM